MQDLNARRSERDSIRLSRPAGVGRDRVPDARSLRRRLLAWYDRHRRRLPWRDLDPPDPYATLVSESMLQQTQVATVIPYYLRFMARFPTVQALAAASIEQVLSSWAGLGYYRRCHNLHAAARHVVEAFDGRFPPEPEALHLLPGVGRYTAGAIASIVFDAPVPAVDGNVRRVISRIMGLAGGNGDTSALHHIWAVAGQWVPRKRPGDFNQALMELGATICTPRLPECSTCPLRGSCRYGAPGPQPVSRGTRLRMVADGLEASPTAGPARARRIAKTVRLVTVAIEHRGRLFYRRRPDQGLWAGLWEWPTELLEGKGSPRDLARAVVRQVAGTDRGTTIPANPFHEMVHVLTHRRVDFRAYYVHVHGRVVNRMEGRWLRCDSESELPMSRAQVKLLTALKGHRTRFWNSEF